MIYALLVSPTMYEHSDFPRNDTCRHAFMASACIGSTRNSVRNLSNATRAIHKHRCLHYESNGKAVSSNESLEIYDRHFLKHLK